MEQENYINGTFIDLFAGIGGFRMAFNNEGFKCVFSSEMLNPLHKEMWNSIINKFNSIN